ncbi:putative glutamyl-trna amidotransferase subunit [Phaeomoniella chlamydospora]|uniref:Glutathione hydrolase n=1 Tax=Phaeomoniella chlamydospora TaxID=158046 RepID=A0A0G2EWF3_PHACM|nr:putative glutamyl-trna amidotransferase subunit [Phaeomoniella chlamydospora]
MGINNQILTPKSVTYERVPMDDPEIPRSPESPLPVNKSYRSIVMMAALWAIFGSFLLVTVAKQLVFNVPIFHHCSDDEYSSGFEKDHFGAVATENSICSNIGIDIMKKGGNAADASVGSLLCVGVIGMYHSGIGGGGFMLVRSPGGSYEAIDFRETAPAAAFQDMYKDNPKASVFGGLASGVPGEIRGLQYLHEKYGSLPWRTLVEPAVKVARYGFPVTKDLVRYMNEAISSTPGNYDFLTHEPTWAIDFAPNGTRLGLGDTIYRKRYADTLEAIALNGPEAFYHGAIAETMVQAVQASGGTLTLEDLENYEVAIRPVAEIEYRGYRLFSTSAPSSGGVALSVLKVLEGYEDFFAPDTVNISTHRLDEAIRFGYGQRANLGDPPFVPGLEEYQEEMWNATTAANNRAKISDLHTLNISAYDPKGLESLDTPGTSHLVTADHTGLAITLTTTINLLFGSHLMIPETGIIMNDEMNDFSIPGVRNAFGEVRMDVRQLNHQLHGKSRTQRDLDGPNIKYSARVKKITERNFRGRRSSVTIDVFRDILSKNNIKIPLEADEKTYHVLLQSADEVIDSVNQEPDYIDPRLAPQETVSERTYWKPSATENPFNAWSHRCELVAKSPSSSVLKGRKVALKDNISIAGLPTTLGTFPQLHGINGPKISPIDATVTSRVLAAGATLIGSATCENYSASPLSYTSASGPVHNAWKRGYNTGGSSSGCATLIAGNSVKESKGGEDCEFGELAEMAMGGDQGGSIRLPASYAGIYGLKPTHGLVPYTGIASLHMMIDHTGPMAKELIDVATLLSVVAGYDGIDPRMSPESPLRENVKDYAGLLSDYTTRNLEEGESIGSGLKIGVLKEGFEVADLDPAVRERVRSWAFKIFGAAGSKVGETSVPLHTQGPVIWTAATRAAMAEYGVQGAPAPMSGYPLPHITTRWPPDQEMYDLLSAVNPAVVNMIFSSMLLKEKYGVDVVGKAHRKVLELRAAYDKALEDYDILVTPVTPTVAMPHPKLSFDPSEGSTVREKMMLSLGISANTCPFNATGHPAMSVPCGFLKDKSGNELPIGMQIISKRFDEETIFKAAAAFEVGQKVYKADYESGLM